jgi:hypothetical protein
MLASLAPLRLNGARVSRLRAANAGGPSARPVLFPSLRPDLLCLPEGGGAPKRRRQHWGTFGKAPRPPLRAAGAPSGAPPRRFLTRPPHFLAWTGGLHLTLSGRHWRRRSSRPVQPLKAAPSSGAGGDRASWDGVTSLVCRRRRPRSADRTSPGDALSEWGWGEYSPEQDVRQAYNRPAAIIFHGLFGAVRASLGWSAALSARGRYR